MTVHTLYVNSERRLACRHRNTENITALKRDLRYVFEPDRTKEARERKKRRSSVENRRFILVRGKGLEPSRQRHTHLKRACLPIPASSHISWDCAIIAPRIRVVNHFLEILLLIVRDMCYNTTIV